MRPTTGYAPGALPALLIMYSSLALWLALLGIFGSVLFTTVAYALRMMSRVALEENLARRGRADALDAILAIHHELSLTASALRLMCNITVVVAISYYFSVRLSNAHPFEILGYTLGLATPILLLVSVAVPQAWAKYAGEYLIASAWPMLRVAYRVLYPLVAAMKLVDELVRRLAGVSISDAQEAEAEQVEQEILAAVEEGTAEGAVDEDQRKMIESVISFRDLQVGQIMTPRTDVVAVPVTATLAELGEKILKDGLSRVPVFEGSLDNIVGVVYAKDLLSLLTRGSGFRAQASASEVPDPRAPAPEVFAFDIRKFMRPPLFVPRTKPLRDLLRELRLQQVHIAIVLDEFGGTSGLVTTEDILEEIVGDIADEYEKPTPADAELKRIDERTVEVDAKMNITELNRALELHLPEDQDYQTIGGLVISTLGTIPPKGETLKHEGLTITVLESEPRRVKRLRLELPETTPPETAEEPHHGHE